MKCDKAMKCLISLSVMLLIFVADSEGSKWPCRPQSTPRVQFMMQEMAFPGEDVWASCVADSEAPPRIMVVKDNTCNAKVEYLNTDGEGSEQCGRTDFIVRNMRATCTFRCILHGSCQEKTIPIMDARIVSPSSNVSISEGMPVRLNCTVMANAHLRHHKLLWVEGNTFVPSGDPRYSMSSSHFDYDTKTQDYYMTVRQVDHQTAYTCALVSTSGKVIDSRTHHIFVTKADSMTTSLLEYLKIFFNWA